MAKNGSDSLTIDQLAQRTGMTVRNIRAHQSRGLLEPPEVKGRTGYYGGYHVERILLIRDLQADGYSLDLIGRILARAGDESADALRFTARAARAVDRRGRRRWSTRPSWPGATAPTTPSCWARPRSWGWCGRWATASGRR